MSRKYVIACIASCVSCSCVIALVAFGLYQNQCRHLKWCIGEAERWDELIGGRIMVAGTAEGLKAGPAILVSDGLHVVCRHGIDFWPATIAGKRICAVGVLGKQRIRMPDAGDVVYYELTDVKWWIP